MTESIMLSRNYYHERDERMEYSLGTILFLIDHEDKVYRGMICVYDGKDYTEEVGMDEITDWRAYYDYLSEKYFPLAIYDEHVERVSLN